MNISFKENSQKNGFSAFITTDQKDAIAQKVNECIDGNCSCNCDIEVMKKIENIELLKNENGVEIKISTELSPSDIAPMMKECLGS